MPNFLAPIINTQILDGNGKPLSGGLVEVYLAGTSTAATTFSDGAGLVPNTWPVVLNTLGVNSQGSVWLTGGAAYKFIIKDSAGVVQRTIDDVRGINDNTGAADQWVAYQEAPTYVNATTFTVAGDQTQIFQVGRRITSMNTGGVVNSTIIGSVYSATQTTVTVINDSGALDSGLAQVSYSLMSVLGTSLPGGMINYGECRLTKSGDNLLLAPLNGNRITINGSVCTIPSAGVTLASTGLTPTSLYHIYVYMDGASLAMEASATVSATDAVTGVRIKSGDPTRTLVGMAIPTTGPAWVDDINRRYVVSWFNRRSINCRAGLASNTSNSGTAANELSTGLRINFLLWPDEAASFTFDGFASNSTLSAVTRTYLSLDGALQDGVSVAANNVADQLLPLSVSAVVSGSQGAHYITPFVSVSAGTGTWGGSGTPGTRCSIKGTIRG